MPSGVQFACLVDGTGIYLGDAERVGEFVGVGDELAEHGSVWVPAGNDGTVTVIRADNIQVLWRALGGLGNRYRDLNKTRDMDQTVFICMPCGYVIRYIAFDDLPTHSEQCPCGDPNHWIVKYKDDAL